MPGFVLPNAWDAGSARILAEAGFAAIATTSAGISFAAGRPDGSLDLDEMLTAVGRIVDAVEVPVNADLEAGYGPTADDVAGSVRRAVDLGVAGVNLEDAVAGRLFALDQAAARIAAARAAAPAGSLVINARVDSFLVAGVSDATTGDALERALAYVGAGADCVFLPGLVDLDRLRALTARIPVPVNSVIGLGGVVHTAAALWDAGVTRISIGGSLARAALAFVAGAAAEMRGAGTFGFAATSIPHSDLQRRFAPPAPD